MESSGITFLVGPRHLTSVGSPPEFRQLFGTFPGNQHLNTMKVLVKWDDLIEHHFTFKWSGNISQQRPLQQLPSHLGKIPKKTFPRKLEDVGLVVCGKLSCMVQLLYQGVVLEGQGSRVPSFWRPEICGVPLSFCHLGVGSNTACRRNINTLVFSGGPNKMVGWSCLRHWWNSKELQKLRRLRKPVYLCLSYWTVQLFVVYKFWALGISSVLFGGYAKKPL